MGENPNKNTVIEDYVLSTILSWHALRDKEAVKKATLDTFDKSELQAAMKAFCFNKSVVGVVEPASTHRNADLCFDAIYAQIVSLDAHGQMPSIVIGYKDLFKVPRSFPTGEASSDSSEERLSFLERSLTRILSQNDLIMKELLDFKKTPPPSFRQIVSQQAQSQPVPFVNSTAQERNHTSAQERNHISAQERNHTSVTLESGNRAVQNMINGSSNAAVLVEAVAHGSNSNDQWKTQNRRRPRPKAIQGSYKSQAAGHTWSAAPRDIFVYHADIETTTEDIKTLIAETSKVNVLQVEKKNHADAYYGSFRVSVRRNEFEEATKPEYWPDGWSIREYFRPRPKKDSNQPANGSVPHT